MRKIPAVLVATAVGVALAGCGSTTATKAVPAGQAAGSGGRGALAISVDDRSITSPASIPAGLTDVTVTSTGSGRAHVIIERLNDKVTFSQIEKASSDEQDRLAAAVGGNGAVGPGGSTTVVLDLSPGKYEIVQVSQSQGPSPTHRLEVKSSSATAAAAPVAKGEVVAAGRTLSLPSGFDGKGTWKVTNNDAKDDHEASVLQIAPGKTLSDVVAYFASRDRSGPAPAVAMGGMGDLPAGHSGWMVLDLPPGNYAVACFVPDDSGMPHVAMGMITPFRVT